MFGQFTSNCTKHYLNNSITTNWVYIDFYFKISNKMGRVDSETNGYDKKVFIKNAMKTSKNVDSCICFIGPQIPNN